MCFYIWDKFLGRVASRGQWEGRAQKEALDKVKGAGPEITLVDPATGEVSKLQLPTFLDPKSKAFWKPLADGICSRMKKRGMSDALMLGIMCDYMPSMETMKALDELFPGAKWVSQAHPWPHKTVASRVGYMSSVHSGDPGNYRDPSIQRLHGWREPNLRTHYWRLTRDNWPITTFRLMGEMTIMRRYRGFARMGGDFFPVLRDKRGNLVGRIPNRYMKSYWNNLNIEIHLLARGEKGPVATARFEMMREGIQECEARIFIERALTDKTLRAKLGEKLAARCQNVLDERTRFIRRGLCSYMASGHYNFWAWQRGGFWVVPTVFGGQWYVASGWQDRSKQLYSSAAHIARALHTVR